MTNDKAASKLSEHGPTTASCGFCRTCGREHHLGHGRTLQYCHELMRRFRLHKSLDLARPSSGDNSLLSTASLYGEARGKMFGVLECLAGDGAIVFLQAFSGQFNGLWEIDGWAPPLFDTRRMTAISFEVEKEIKRVGAEMIEPNCTAKRELQLYRRQLSQDLMRQIHGLYRLRNFRGEELPLFSAYCGENGIPTGTGDCCAPKLFNLAARLNLIPLGIAEFYWGRENKSGSRQEGCFYPSCTEKCRPILGFMLCGLEDLHAKHPR